MVKKVLGDVTEGVGSAVDSVTGAVEPIATKVLAGGEATLEETKSLASAVLGGETGQLDEKVSAIAQKVIDGAQATVEETKKLASSLLGQ